MNYELAQDLTIKKIEETIFVLDRKNSVLHSFNDTGAFLWERLEQHVAVEGLCQMLTESFEVSPEQARCDISEFLNTLEEQKIISLRK
jgi:hypothetical protein